LRPLAQHQVRDRRVCDREIRRGPRTLGLVGDGFVLRYACVEVYSSARRHGISDADIWHAVVVAEQDDGKVLYLGPDRAGNLLEIIAVARVDGTEIVIHAMHMRRMYESLLREMGDTDG
jgi:hypothetical protein